ncbi:MAG TPA: polysaccharide biosynthesis/export family protein [Pyrinomonadaceae bacterium]|nr:polysaccharide biosynthesis/export family protein [Pyrinomonadaceae bacterium]
MNIQRLFCLPIVVACCAFGVVFAQQPATPKTEPATLESQAPRPYLLGPGDVLEVTIDQMTHPTRRVQVDGDGYVSSLPFIDPIKAKCRTERQLQQDITKAYDKYIKEPFISVLVLERNSRTPASIFGAVRQTTKVPTLRKLRLNELIAAAGGFSERAAGTIQILHTEPVLCPEPGQEAESMPINGTSIPLQVVKISDLLKGTTNPVIRSGDLVLVTEAEPVYITGSVVSPGSIMMRDNLTLSRALAMVGGTRKEAKVSEVRIFRQIPGSTDQEILKVDFGAIKKNQTADVLLKPYDVIDVSENGLTPGSVIDILAGIFLGGVRHSVPLPIP